MLFFNAVTPLAHKCNQDKSERVSVPILKMKHKYRKNQILKSTKAKRYSCDREVIIGSLRIAKPSVKAACGYSFICNLLAKSLDMELFLQTEKNN